MHNERILDTFVSNGILFELIEKPASIYAGKLGFAAKLGEEPDIGLLMDQYRGIMLKIEGAVAPQWWLGISINFGKATALNGYMFAAEVASDLQPAGVDVYQVPASQYIRIRKDDKNIAKLLGKAEYQTFELYPLIYDEISKRGYRYADNGAQEIECDYSQDMSIAFAYVAVERG